MLTILERMFELRDEKYAGFQAKLTPGIKPELFIGVRIPVLRSLAKEYYAEPEHEQFIKELPHKYYDENMLHGLLIEQIKDYGKCIDEIEKFLLYVDNWAVCDIMSPKVLKKNKDKLIVKIREWVKSDETYTCRFGMEMLMSHFLDDDFEAEYLEIPAAVRSEEYYVNMMTAWFFATALAKQWDDTIPYITGQRLDKWTHNKTIQKSIESRRVSKEKKDYLRTLKL